MDTAKVVSVFAQQPHLLATGLVYNAKIACLGIPVRPVSKSAKVAFATPAVVMVSATKVLSGTVAVAVSVTASGGTGMVKCAMPA